MRVVAKIGTASITDDRGAIDARRPRQAGRRSGGATGEWSRGDRGVVRGGGRWCGSARHGESSDRHPDTSGDLRCRPEPAGRGVQPGAGAARLGRRSGAARPARLRRSAPVLCMLVAPSTGCWSSAVSPWSTRTTPWRATSCATATTTASPHCWPTACTPMSWCCSPTWTACTPPTRGATRQRR